MSDYEFWLYWTVLVSVFLGAFLVAELYAVATGRNDTDTLSAWVWRLIGTRRGWTWRTTPLRIGVLMLFAWLAEHFAFGWI